MNDNVRQALEEERAVGEEKQRIWDTHIEPFFTAKQSELFEAFKQVSINDSKQLQILKLSSYALSSLQAEFEGYITTGKLAAHQLLKGNE